MFPHLFRPGNLPRQNNAMDVRYRNILVVESQIRKGLDSTRKNSPIIFRVECGKKRCGKRMSFPEVKVRPYAAGQQGSWPYLFRAIFLQKGHVDVKWVSRWSRALTIDEDATEFKMTFSKRSMSSRRQLLVDPSFPHSSHFS